MDKRAVLQAWWDLRGEATALPEAYTALVQDPQPGPALSRPLAVTPPVNGQQHLQLVHTGVAISFAPGTAMLADDVASRLYLTPTSSLLANMGRIFAACTVGRPLLLCGGPGIGKTAVVEQVAKLTGRKCVRINCSANTSTAQLFGSMMPRWED